MTDAVPVGLVHHVELWVPDLARAVARWEPLMIALGCTVFQDWPAGRSWRLGDAYLVVEQSPAMISEPRYDRMRAGLNHLALRGTRPAAQAAVAAGWSVRVDTGPTIHLVDDDGFEVELVLG